MSGQGGFPPNQGGGYQQGGYPPNQGGWHQGGYPQQGGYQPAGGYQQGPWTAQNPQQGGPPNQPGGRPGWGGAPSPKTPKSPLLIIGIVVAAVVLLVALGGIFIALGSGGGGTPGAPITPDASQAPTPKSTSGSGSDSGSGSGSSSSSPTSQSSGGGGGGSASTVDLGHSISLTPASGYTVESQKTSLVVVSNGTEVFVGQVAEEDTDADPKQIVDSYHRQLAEDYTDVTYTDAKTVDLKNSKLKGALGGLTGTSSSGSGSQDVGLESLASVRTSDGLTVVGTILYGSGSDTSQVGKDFAAMVNSMLKTQAG